MVVEFELFGTGLSAKSCKDVQNSSHDIGLVIGRKLLQNQQRFVCKITVLSNEESALLKTKCRSLRNLFESLGSGLEKHVPYQVAIEFCFNVLRTQRTRGSVLMTILPYF
jgi:hypothetical protein